MTRFMDVHTIDGGESVDDVAKAHMADLPTHDRYDVSYLRYWVNEPPGTVCSWSTNRTPAGQRRCTVRYTGWSPTRSCTCTRGPDLRAKSVIGSTLAALAGRTQPERSRCGTPRGLHRRPT